MTELEAQRNRLETTVYTMIYRELGTLMKRTLPMPGVLSIRSVTEYEVLRYNVAVERFRRYCKRHDYYALIKIKDTVTPTLPDTWNITVSNTKLCNDSQKDLNPDKDLIFDAYDVISNSNITDKSRDQVVVTFFDPALGKLTRDGDKMTYTPPVNYAGWDRVQYSARIVLTGQTDLGYLYFKIFDESPSLSVIESGIPTAYRITTIPSFSEIESKVSLSTIIREARSYNIPVDHRPPIIAWNLEEKEYKYLDIYDDLLRINKVDDGFLIRDPTTGDTVSYVDGKTWDPFHSPMSTVISPLSNVDDDLIWTYKVVNGSNVTLDLKTYLLEWKVPSLKSILEEASSEAINSPVEFTINKYTSIVSSHAHNAYATSNIDVDIQIINTGTDEEPVYYFEVNIKNNVFNKLIPNLKDFDNPVKTDNQDRKFTVYISNDDLVSRKGGKVYYDFVKLQLLDEVRQVLSIH